MKKILATIIFMSLLCGLAGADDYDIGGLWHIKGNGYVDRSFIRVSLALGRNANIYTVVSGDIESHDVRFLTGYDINLELTASRAEINTWKDRVSERFTAPVPLPDMRPTVNNPYTLPTVNNNGLNYTVTFTSTTSGTVRIQGNLKLDVVGSVELDSICKIWKDGSPEPKLDDDEDKDSGCNSGYGILGLALIPVLFFYKSKGGRAACSEQILA